MKLSFSFIFSCQQQQRCMFDYVWFVGTCTFCTLSLRFRTGWRRAGVRRFVLLWPCCGAQAWALASSSMVPLNRWCMQLMEPTVPWADICLHICLHVGFGIVLVAVSTCLSGVDVIVLYWFCILITCRPVVRINPSCTCPRFSRSIASWLFYLFNVFVYSMWTEIIYTCDHEGRKR